MSMAHPSFLIPHSKQNRAMFQDITQGPGAASFSTYTWEILIMLTVAFLLGLLLGYILWYRYRKMFLELQAEFDRLKALHTDLEKEHASLRYKADALDVEVHHFKDRILHLEADVAGWKAKAAQLEAALASAGELEVETSRSVGIAAAMGAPAMPPPVPDDLKRVEGIGPKIEKLLNDHNVWTFGQLSTTSVDRLRSILDDAGPNYRISDPTTWPRQAELAGDGKWDELKEYQDYLSGGKDLGQG